MKITSVEMHPANSASVAVFSFRDPARLNPYTVREIEGLDPDNISARYMGYDIVGNVNQFYELVPPSRDIVLKLDLNPTFSAGKTYGDLRDDLYRLISTYRTGLVELWFKQGNTVLATISGRVSRVEAPKFAKNPQVFITISCTEGLFKAPNRVNFDVSGFTQTLATLIDNQSTSPHGFIMELLVLKPIDSFGLYDPVNVDWEFELGYAGAASWANVGDHIQIVSERNNKAVNLIRAGVTTPRADLVQQNGGWPVLFPGSNAFSIETYLGNATVTNAVSWVSASYLPTYWGI